jgi:hypothetical protein
VDREDEVSGDGCHESASLRPSDETAHGLSFLLHFGISRMADGLGMDVSEWEELRRMVEDSFWVTRVIGGSILLLQYQLCLEIGFRASKRLPAIAGRRSRRQLRSSQRLWLLDVSPITR